MVESREDALNTFVYRLPEILLVVVPNVQEERWIPRLEHEAECRAMEEKAAARLKASIEQCASYNAVGLTAAVRRGERLEAQLRAALCENRNLQESLATSWRRAREAETDVASERGSGASEGEHAESFQARVRQLESEAEQARGALASATRERDGLAIKLAEATREKDGLSLQLNAAQEQRVSLESRLEESQRQVDALRGALEEHQARASDLQAQLAGLESWAGVEAGSADARATPASSAQELMELRETALSAREDALAAREAAVLRAERGALAAGARTDGDGLEMKRQSLDAAERALARHAKDVGFSVLLWVVVGC